jgi:ribonuclease HI
VFSVVKNHIMGKKQKYYVVWKGVSPGIYTSWTDCQLQIKGYDGALYKSFETMEEAEHALASPVHHYIGGQNAKSKAPSLKSLPENFDMNCVAVDAACSGNPGPMEYRGVYLLTGQQIFHYGPVYGTNNIGEFLAIVHALALMKQKGISMTIYSDSRNALSWVKQKKCKTKLERTPKTEELFQMIERAENWLKNNSYDHIPLLKWETDQWGEVPADFGRK